MFRAVVLSNKVASRSRNFASTVRVLGIECSCDDTGIAVVCSDHRILAEQVLHQDDIHRPFHGVVPSLAARAHRRNINSVIENVLSRSGISFADLTAVAVTYGPGLAGCLNVGIAAARALTQTHPHLKLIAVNHMEGHALVPRLEHPNIVFPFLTLLISGGHTQLLVCRAVGSYTLLGDTLDDAVGECVDKVARALDLDFLGGGGKALERLASCGTASSRFGMKVPLLSAKNCDFSFSGLKTASLELLKQNPLIKQTPLEKQDFAATFQQTIIEHLADRVRRGANWCRLNAPGIRHLVISGGVASNKQIRASLSSVARELDLELIAPAPHLCTDNGVMIAWAGIENLSVNKNIISSSETLVSHPRLRLDPSGTDYFPFTRSSYNKASRES